MYVPAEKKSLTLRHLAVIVDGNRRWAKSRGLPSSAGYRNGGKRVMELLTWCENVAEIEVVTLWPLSTENLNRPESELTDLLSVIVGTTAKIAETQRWRVRLIGCLDRLPEQATKDLLHTAHQTDHLTGKVVNIAAAYGGRDEIARAVKNLITARQAAGDLFSDVHPDEIGRYLDTAGQSDPDLVIRTSGEQRLSGFMPWQTAYSEFYFTPTPWPEFSHNDFIQALSWYHRRTRNYGK
ncbi:polyprenyl diphosphate synthase [Streptomyces sp. NPDC056480]|uniref:polyprenyl diphosphate synthase n=1 Tax=Streptomyces sp. NPDC056480 TaxID=3345833 RepID=UPI0036C2759C